MMKIERMKENGKKNLHARASHALDKGDSKVLLIYDNHLNKGLYIYSGKEIRRGISAKHEPFTNFLRKGQLFFSNNFSCEGCEREIGTWPTHWMMDVPTTWTAQVTNATEKKKGGKQKKILGALSGGWRRGLVADYPPRFSSKRNRFGAVMRKRPANKVQTHGDNNRPSILEIYTDECRCQKRFRPLFVYCTRRQLRERKTIIREML